MSGRQSERQFCRQRALIVLGVCLLLAGCGTYQAHRARTALVGASEPDALACLGVPDHAQYVSPGQHVMTWIYAQTGTDVNVQYGLYALQLGRPGICHTTVRFVGGRVAQVTYQDADVSATNPDSICGRMVEDCLSHRQNTPLPADFDPDAVLRGPTITVKRGVTRPTSNSAAGEGDQR